MAASRTQVLVTGGAGYVGSHVLVLLVECGYRPIVFDNLVNSSSESVHRVEEITGVSIPIVKDDIRDFAALNRTFGAYNFEAVIHLAGLKAVGQSIKKPIDYYENNVIGSLQLLKVMDEHQVKTIVFSSSATVYGNPASVPIDESATTVGAQTPYGSSKLFVEQILSDLYSSDPAWRVINLRYFNPVGAHKSGMIGEDPIGVPNNLLPFIAQTAIGKRNVLQVYGGDYETHDGTGVRDYIHVMDLARGHVRALEKLKLEGGLWTINLGTGVGYSVLEMIRAFEKASGRKVPYDVVSRRPGDVAVSFADVSFAKQVLDWEALLDCNDMCRDAWNWQSNNPDGFA